MWILARLGMRLVGKRCICDEVGKIRYRETLDVTNAEISQNVVNRGHRLLTNDAAKASLELILKRQPGKLRQNSTLLILRDSI